MTRVFEIELKCPCCKCRFMSKALLSTNTGPQTTDLHQMAFGFQPVLIVIHTCLSCGYTGYIKDFEEKKVSKDLTTFVKQIITPLVRGKKIFPGRQYEYAAWIAEHRGDPHFDVGRLYLRAAWCCNYEGRKDEERFYRRKAIEYFESVFQKKEIPEEDLARYTYLIGELYRRIGNVEKAGMWFDRVINAPGEGEWRKWFIDLAIQQKTNPKEFVGK